MSTIYLATRKQYNSSRQTLREPFTTPKTAVKGNKGNDATVKILETSWRKSTQCKYNNYIKYWLAYSKTMGKIEVTHLLHFQSAMFNKRLCIYHFTIF